MAAAKTIYRFTRPGSTEFEYVEKGGRAVLWVTFGYFEGEGWLHMGYSSQEDIVKATRAGRSTNPYAADYAAAPVTVVTAEERDAEIAARTAQVEETIEVAETSETTEVAEVAEATPVAHVDMIEPHRGIVLVSGLPNFTESPQSRLGYDPDARRWYVDDDENGIVYRAGRPEVICAYLLKLSRVGMGFDPKKVKIEIHREY